MRIREGMGREREGRGKDTVNHKRKSHLKGKQNGEEKLRRM